MYQRYSKEQKLAWIEAWQDSGMAVSEFCRDQPFSAGSFYKWKKGRTTEDIGHFIKISTIPDSSAVIRFTYPNGVRLEINQSIPLDQIKQLLNC